MSAIYVLLSTYNGEEYLGEQLESVMSQQTDAPIYILARDDGSTDQTVELLREYESKLGKMIAVEYGRNIGVVRSFLELLKRTSDGAFYTFCDQDDIWQPDKLQRAIDALAEAGDDVPALYCSRTEMMDNDHRTIGLWPPVPRRGAGFGNALIENVAVGCTIVINAAARRLLLSREPQLDKLIMHDWWMYLCISAFGRIIYDPVPSIRYRQHESNAVGGQQSRLRRWIAKSKQLTKRHGRLRYRIQAEEFLRLYGDNLSPDYCRWTQDFIDSHDSWRSRLRFICSTKLYRQSRADDILFRILYFAKKI